MIYNTSVNKFITSTVTNIIQINVTNITGDTANFKNGWVGTKSSPSDWAVGFFAGVFSYTGW